MESLTTTGDSIKQKTRPGAGGGRDWGEGWWRGRGLCDGGGEGGGRGEGGGCQSIGLSRSVVTAGKREGCN